MNWDKYKKYFKPAEFYSPDSKVEKMQESFMNMLFDARVLAKVPFKIGSGYRTTFQNTMVGGVKDSAHLKGCGADIHIDNSSMRFAILKAVMDVGFNRIGIAKTFIHVDNDKSKSKKVVWGYWD